MSEEIRGPKAPKDPTKKRPCFFVMRSKEVTGSPQPDGTGVQFIYEDGGNDLTGLEALAFVRERHSFKAGDRVRGIHQMATEKIPFGPLYTSSTSFG